MNRRFRILRMGLATVLGLRPQGFFIPYRYAGEIPDPAVAESYREIENRLDQRQHIFRALLEAASDYGGELRTIGQAPPPAPRFDQDWFPTLDAVAAYTMVRQQQPGRLLEVGSGHSTRFFAQAVADGGFPCSITAIDPAPRALIEGLPVRFIRKTLQEALVEPQAIAAIRDLGPGDLISIDSSHILMPGSDVDVFLNRILPQLPPGVLLHIHDIFLPHGYPIDWSWRGYNEQNAIAPLVQDGNYDVLFASHYVSRKMAADLAGSIVAELPVKAGARAASLWLRKQAAAD